MEIKYNSDEYWQYNLLIADIVSINIETKNSLNVYQIYDPKWRERKRNNACNSKQILLQAKLIRCNILSNDYKNATMNTL